GSATGFARPRHRLGGSPAITRINGSTTRTPSVSPIHHETQLIARSGNCTTPRADRPPNDNVALVKQKSGERNKKHDRSRQLSRGAGQPTAYRSTFPPIAACSIDPAAMTTAAAKPVSVGS